MTLLTQQLTGLSLCNHTYRLKHTDVNKPLNPEISSEDVVTKPPPPKKNLQLYEDGADAVSVLIMDLPAACVKLTQKVKLLHQVCGLYSLSL